TRYCPVTNYTYSATSGASIVGASNRVANCDNCVVSVALPFVYSFYAQPFTSFNVSSNGTIQFNSSNGTSSRTCLPASGFNNAIFAYWGHVRTFDDADCSNCGVYTSVSGSAPSRIFNVRWLGCTDY